MDSYALYKELVKLGLFQSDGTGIKEVCLILRHDGEVEVATIGSGSQKFAHPVIVDDPPKDPTREDTTTMGNKEYRTYKPRSVAVVPDAAWSDKPDIRE